MFFSQRTTSFVQCKGIPSIYMNTKCGFRPMPSYVLCFFPFGSNVSCIPRALAHPNVFKLDVPTGY